MYQVQFLHCMLSVESVLRMLVHIHVQYQMGLRQQYGKRSCCTSSHLKLLLNLGKFLPHQVRLALAVPFVKKPSSNISMASQWVDIRAVSQQYDIEAASEVDVGTATWFSRILPGRRSGKKRLLSCGRDGCEWCR